jgi:uncharacterized protein YcbK (DUF882 family)
MLSEHFSEDELRCKCGCGSVQVTCSLLQLLEDLRERIGRPLPIVSGYRCPRHNRRVGGARRSQHVLGTAADLPVGYVTAAQAASCGARGVGTKGPWAVHVDVREGPIAAWRY